ncbi:putative WRKY transcription factor 19 [Vitis vinifera]|uniref:Putative WRKY transcription factor 19 n=1 Tax=Vitis vinifera TaxID=29760 RepID=A0A438JDR1_VITVI|nr:putative WRKY transcription factor 19 [Vitis vinifera]
MEEIFPRMMDSISNDVHMVGIYGLRGIALAGDHNWFGPGSRIIIITRAKHLLENHSKEDYETLSNFVVHYVNALPLGLKVLGCFLYGKTSGIQVLGDKCLISIVDNKIWMHDLLQQMGQDIVGQEFPEEPGKWSRLCYPEVNLRLLKIYSDHEFALMGKHSKVKLSKDFEFPSYELRYLYWQGYPLESLPSSFYAEDLVELDMCYSSLKQLWESDMLSSFPSIIDMEALEILNLSGCSELEKFPDIQGNMEHLLGLYLASTAIEELPSSIEHLIGLVLLDLKRTRLAGLSTMFPVEVISIQLTPMTRITLEISFEATHRFNSSASNVVKKCGAKIEGEFGAHEESELWSTSKPLAKTISSKMEENRTFRKVKIIKFARCAKIRSQTPSEDDFSEDEWLSFTFLGVMEASFNPLESP